MEEMEVAEESSGGNSEDEESEILQLTSREMIQRGVREIQRSFTRSQRTRIKLLTNVQLYFERLAPILRENEKYHSRVISVIEDLQDFIVETTNLSVSLSNPPARISEIYDTLYDMGAYIETVIIAVYTRCQRTGLVFGEIMKEFFNSLLDISAKNPESWLYSVLISPIVLHMMNAFSHPDHEEFRITWCYEIGDLMFKIAQAVLSCGDFSCQNYLVTVISCWAKWAPPGRSLPVINSVFACVKANDRKELLRTSDGLGENVRVFLNALNLSPRGPKSVIPISCMYLFVCDTEIRPPEHQVYTNADFWVDFSIVSGRLHVFYSIPNAASLVSLSIRRDQVDSVCLNWVINDGRGQDASAEDSDTQSTFMKDEKVLFFHIVLSVDFEQVTSDIASLMGKKHRSIYLVFRNGELVEKVLRDMGYNIHECGTNNCERPRALRRLLTTEHRLSYTESWCPESQVFGLDKSLNETNVTTFSQKSGHQDLDDCNFQDVLIQKSINESFGGENNVSCLSEANASYASQEHSPMSDAQEGPSVTDLLNLPTSLSLTNVSILYQKNGLDDLNESLANRLNLSQKENDPEFCNSCDKAPGFGNELNLSFRSDATAFYPSVSSERTSPFSDIGAAANDILNVSTTSTNFEDPLPLAAREKYAHLYKHAPFHQPSSPSTEMFRRRLSATDQGTPTNNRSREKVCDNLALTPTRRFRKATPKVTTPINEPTTPLSEPGSRNTFSQENEVSKSLPTTPTNFHRALKVTNNLALTPSRTPRNTKRIRKPTPKPPLQEPKTSTPINAPAPPFRHEILETPGISPSRSIIDQSAESNAVSSPRKLGKFKFVRNSSPKAATNIHESPSPSNLTFETVADGNESDASMESGSLSPVFGFSRTLDAAVGLGGSSPASLVAETSQLPSTVRKRSQRISDSGKSPCYANAWEEWNSRIIEKEKSEEFDPYDLWTSSEMDEFRKQLFPKIKTYSAKKKRQLNFILGGKGKIVKLKKRNKEGLAKNKNCDDDINAEDFAYTPAPTKKYSSFFKKR